MKIGIVGSSEGGKTFLAKKIAKEHMIAGRPVLVCDPLGSRWPARWVTTDARALIARAQACQSATLVVDESGLSFERDSAFQWLFVTSRHLGHVVYVLMHDHTDLLPKWRKQLNRLYLFSCDGEGAAEWGRYFPKCREELIRLAPQLNQYEFLFLEKFPKAPLRPQKLAV